jgi:hypothetical protein
MLIFGLNIGGNEVPWSHPAVLTILPLAGVFLITFLVVEKYAKEPILPLRLLSHRTPLAAGLVLTHYPIADQVKLVLLHGSILGHIQSPALLSSCFGPFSSQCWYPTYPKFDRRLTRLAWLWDPYG